MGVFSELSRNKPKSVAELAVTTQSDPILLCKYSLIYLQFWDVFLRTSCDVLTPPSAHHEASGIYERNH